MSEVDFKSLLESDVESAERPKNFPVGNYRAIVINHEFGKSSKKQTDYVRFSIKLLTPEEDVDMELFEEVGGMAALNERRPLSLDQYITKDALYRLREFLENSLQINCSGRNFDQTIPESTNCELLVTIQHTQGRKEGDSYMTISDHAPVD